MEDPNPKLLKLWFVHGAPTLVQRQAALAEGWSFRNAHIASTDSFIEKCRAVCGDVPEGYKSFGVQDEPVLSAEVPHQAQAGTQNAADDEDDAPTAPGSTAPADDGQTPVERALADGWLKHPDRDGWYYKGQDVKNEKAINKLYKAPKAV